MTLKELLDRFRTDTRDTATPPHFGNAEVLAWLSEAEEEACIRGKLLFDDTTTALVEIAVSAATREYALDSRVTEIVTAWLTDAADNEYPVDIVTRPWLDEQRPDWRRSPARRPTALMQLSKRIAFDAEPDAAYTLSLSVYRKPLVPLAARQSVSLQDSGDTVTHAAHGHSDGEPVMFTEINLTTGIDTEVIYYIRDAATDTYSLCAVPGGAVLPLTDNGTGSLIYLGAEPEVEDLHIYRLVDWAAYRAFDLPDADSYEPDRAQKHLGRFEAYFGPTPGADTRRFHNALRPRGAEWF